MAADAEGAAAGTGEALTPHDPLEQVGPTEETLAPQLPVAHPPEKLGDVV
jgi:hypothetical protein